MYVKGQFNLESSPRDAGNLRWTRYSEISRKMNT
jgi:hypothetical protein